MCRPAFDALDRSWTTLVRSHEATAALERWSTTPSLVAPSLDALVEAIWAANRALADRACADLAARAAADPTAARTLLQVLRPGLRHLGRRLAFGGSFDDVDHELLALAWELIRTYPIDRRPRAIAANILLDVRKRYVRQVLTASRSAVSLESVPESGWAAARSAEHEALDADGPSLRRAHQRLRSAVDNGTVSRASASVVWRTRVQQDHDADVAAEMGVNLRTLQRRRQRAERQLATIA